MNENRLIRELRAFSARRVSFDVNLGAIIVSRGWRLGSQSLLVAAMVSIGVMGAILVSSIHMSSQQANGGTFFILRGLARDIREARERETNLTLLLELPCFWCFLRTSRQSMERLEWYDPSAP